MKKVNRWLFLLAITLLVAGCDFSRRPSHEAPFLFGKGRSSLLEEIGRMDSPSGILPDTFAVENSGSFLFRSTENYYEFFVFDPDRVIVLLSVEPLYYVIIKSEDFYIPFLREFEQMSAGISPEEKVPVSNPWLKKIGLYSIEVYFTPSQMRYTTGGKLADINSTTHIDPYKLYRAANSIFFYTPDFGEEKIYGELLLKKRYQRESDIIIYARKGSFSESFDHSYISWYERPSIMMNFTVMAGQNLLVPEQGADDVENWETLTIEEQINIDPNLGETGILGYEDIYYQNQDELTDDFALFLTAPLGNSQDEDAAFLQPDAAAACHGICVLIRGPISATKNFLQDEGLDLEPDGPLPVSLIAEDRYDERLYLEWTDERDVTIEYSYDDLDYTVTVTEEKSMSAAVLNGISRGKEVYLRLRDSATGNIVAATSLYYTDIVVTEICYWGSSFRDFDGANDDDWVEVKNISNRDINLGGYDFIIYNTVPREKFWFGPSNSGTASHDALDYVLAPGERLVLAIRAADDDGIDREFFFDDGAFGTPPYVQKTGTIADNKLGKKYRLRVVRDGNTCQDVRIEGDYGSKLPYRSMVRSESGQWTSSTNDSGYAPDNMSGHRNYCTPGTGGRGEL